MNKTKLVILWLLACLGISTANAQERFLDVTSFTELKNDMDARIQAPVEDQNGEKCALIKVVSNVKGLVFDAPALGIVKQDINMGEIWVYVPAGSRTVSILHDDFPTFRNYSYPVKIESAVVYEMKITGHVQNDGTVATNAQMLTLNVQPAMASLYVDDEEMPMDNGLFTAMMPKGVHTYRIEAQEYEPISGSIDLDDTPWVRSFRLKEKFGYIDVRTYPEDGASVFINDALEGTTDFKSKNLTPGSYKVRVEKELYFPKDTVVIVNTGGETTDVKITMTSTIKPKEGRKTFILADAAMGGGSQTSFGAMIGMASTAGFYLHARTDFGSVATSKACDDTGMLTSGGEGAPYYTGSTKKARLSATAGYVQRLTLNNPFKYGGMGGLYAFAGAGYGYRTLAWESSANGINTQTEWIENSDHSAKGIAAEIGVIGRFGSFAVSMSYHTVSFKYHEAAIGLGLFF